MIIGLYAFNCSNVQSWPIPGCSTKWFSPAIAQPDDAGGARAVAQGGRARDGGRARARLTAALGVHRFRFFGREAVSFLLVLPIALPGIITGMALNSYLRSGR